MSPGEWLRDSESLLFFATALAASQLPARPEERPVRDQELGTAVLPPLQEVSRGPRPVSPGPGGLVGTWLHRSCIATAAVP